MANLTIAWQISTIEFAGFSTWPSVAYSPAGQLSVAYHCSNFHTLRLATLNAAGTWDVDTADIHLLGESSPSLVYRFTQPAIGYVAGGFQEIRYALKRGGTPPWTIETVVMDTPSSPAMRFMVVVGGIPRGLRSYCPLALK